MGISNKTATWWLMTAVACGALACTSLGCSKPVIEPKVASSAAHAGYAQGYPATVNATISAFGEAQSDSKSLSAGFAAYPDALTGDDVDFNAVADMYERAAAVGNSSAYVERVEQLDGARTFFADEKDNINKKVAGSVSYVAKQAKCTADVQSAAVISLDKVIKERLEANLRDANDAHRLLERERNKLGKKNAAALEVHLDEIAQASYLSHIAMVRHKVKLRRLIADASAVEGTLTSAIEAEHAYQAEAGRDDKDKAASQARIDELKSSKGNLASAKQSAESTNKDIEARITQSQKTFRDALDKLVADVRGRAKS